MQFVTICGVVQSNIQHVCLRLFAPRSPPGLCPWTPLGDFCPRPPRLSPLSKFLATPVCYNIFLWESMYNIVPVVSRVSLRHSICLIFKPIGFSHYQPSLLVRHYLLCLLLWPITFHVVDNCQLVYRYTITRFLFNILFHVSLGPQDKTSVDYLSRVFLHFLLFSFPMNSVKALYDVFQCIIIDWQPVVLLI